MIQSVEKALRLLQALDLDGGWVGVRELGRRMSLSPPATHTLLKTLEASGFVESNPETRQYRLGLSSIRLGSGADPLANMRLLAHPYVKTLSQEFDETVAVLAWQRDQAVVVDWLQANHPLAVTHDHGVIKHPVMLASGRVLLAYQSEAILSHYAANENFSKLGVNCPKTKKEFFALIEKVVSDGYAVTKNVADTGVIAIGAPVFDANGKILFAVGCSAPISRTSQGRLNQLRLRLLELTGKMSQSVTGWKASPE